MSQYSIPETQQQLTSTITQQGKLELKIESVPVPSPKDHEVLIQVEAAPINPSDLALLIGPADISSLDVTGSGNDTVATMTVPAALLKTVQQRIDQALCAGNEGAGTVVATGNEAASLLGKTVGAAGGDMFCQYRCVPARSCIEMPDGITATEAASCFVNPLTSLSMVETMRMENHSALVHTAAASNLGQMLVKICNADNVPLVNIVRNEQQVTLLKELGAQHICNSSSDTFMSDLVKAIDATGATLAFDAVGGGKLASQILTAMEISISKKSTQYSRYGSEVHKQVYMYGMLDLNPTLLTRSYGMAWGVGGWVLTPFIQRMGMERFLQLRQRVASEIKTTFASHYSHEVSLAEAISKAAIEGYQRKATGEKYLIKPHS